MMASPSCPRRIQVLATAPESVTFVAVAAEILVFKRRTHVFTLRGHGANVTHLLSFGESLISIDSDNNLHRWDTKAAFGSLVEVMSVEEPEIIDVFDKIVLPSDDVVTCVMHPHTYLNKIVLGYESGRIDIWNVRSFKRVYTVKSHPESGVSTIVQSPVVDVVAVGLSSGQVIIMNLKRDEIISTFSHSGEGAVTAVSFRTDTGCADTPIMVSASANGSLAVWDLVKKQLLTVVRGAHDGHITAATFLQGEPILLTSGVDNSLRQWIFDGTVGSATSSFTPRLLRSRSGHSAPPTLVRFYDERTLLTSGGADRTLRSFSLLRDEQNVQLSQGKGTSQDRNDRAPTITSIASGHALQEREDTFANIATCHNDSSTVLTWQFRRKAIAKNHLRIPVVNGQKDVGTCVAMSGCGHFAVVGTRLGNVHIFNIQSGLHRGTYVRDGATTAHDGEVVAVKVATLNSKVISCGIDGVVCFWEFRGSRSLLGSIEFGSPISCVNLCSDSGLLAVACDDLSVLVVDVDAERSVRRFSGHSNRITDMAFSVSGRDLVTASMDASVRVFDVVSGSLIDWLQFSKPVTSVAFSPRNDYLATTHVNSVAVFLWANKSFFSNVYLQARPKKPAEMKTTTTAAAIGEDNDYDEPIESDDDSVSEDGSVALEEQFAAIGYEPLSDDLVTMSSLPQSRWKYLSNLETIKERNRPKEAPKTHHDAPFFLPTLSGVEPQLAVEDTSNGVSDGDGDDTHEQELAAEAAMPFARCLEVGCRLEDCKMPPSLANMSLGFDGAY